MSLKAVVLNCTLKPSPHKSNTELLTQVVIDALEAAQVTVKTIRLVDLNIKHGIKTDEGEGDDWPAVHKKIIAADILLMATPTWMGHPSSIAQQALERMDALISETDSNDTPVAYNKVAGVVVTGNEDGAHHVISELCGGLIDIGFTIPAQAWTYWNMGPGPGPDYSQTQHGHKWSKETGEAMAKNLVAVAEALQNKPIK